MILSSDLVLASLLLLTSKSYATLPLQSFRESLYIYNLGNEAYDMQQDTSQTIGKELPVTPGVHISGKSAYFENNRPSTSASEKAPFEPLHTPGPRWNANAYEKLVVEELGEDLVARYANDKISNDDVVQDPVRLHPDLHLSGQIISVSFNVPYNIGFSPGNDWVGIGGTAPGAMTD